MSRYGPGPASAHVFNTVHHGPEVLGWLFLAVFFGFLVLGILALIRTWNISRDRRLRFETQKRHTGGNDPAFLELRVRYARGEISSEEFAQRARGLGCPVGSDAPLGGAVPGEPTQSPPPSS